LICLLVYALNQYYEDFFPTEESVAFLLHNGTNYTRETLFQHHSGIYDRCEIKTTQDFRSAIKYYRPMTVSPHSQN
jgi:uncharacterized protein (DUF608 family)